MRKTLILGLAVGGTVMLLSEPAAALRWGDPQSSPCGATLSNGVKTACSRIHSYILWDIPWGQSWETTCATTSGPFPEWGVPKRCIKVWPNINIRGYWEFQYDPQCGTACGSSYIK
jgi:hypothetical protein